jgi:SAM-dependent methyltransferase
VSALAVCAAALLAAPPQDAGDTDFSFALVADVQYADKPDAGRRRYRSSVSRLEEAVRDWSDEELSFLVQLGDLIDGRDDDAQEAADLARVLDTLARTGLPLRHVVGNHGLELPRALLQERLGLERTWYAFARDGWRFVVVDSLWLGTVGRAEDDVLAADARAWVEAHAERPQANTWNGGLGPEQRAWLADELAAAHAAGEHAVVFSHLPAHPAGVNAYAVVHVRADALVVDGRGDVLDRVLTAPAGPLPAHALVPARSPESAPTREHYMGREIARTMHWSGAEWLMREERDEEEAPQLLLEALDVQPGWTVADFGCGNGYHTLPLAERVGPAGRVLGVDIQEEMLDMLRERARAAGAENVVPVRATALQTGLAPASCDLILMVDVYHELDRPGLVLQDARRALRAGGLLALVEFRAEDPDVPIKRLHKMTREQAVRELAANGFELARDFDGLPWQHLLLFRPRW